MKEYTEQNPVFSDTIQITEITDAAHADNINAAQKQLLENTLVLKEKIAESEQLINLKEFLLNQQITSEKNALSGEIVTKVSELEGRVNKKIADEKNALTGVINSKESALNQRIMSEKNALTGVITTKVSEAEGRVNKKIADEKKLLNKVIGDEARKRFEELKGLVNKTAILSANGKTVTITEGNITITTNISESVGKTTFTTVIQKGNEKYTKTSIMTEQNDGSVKIVTSYVKNN